MWTKTIKTKFKGTSVDVQIWLSDVSENDKPIVRIQSMFNEFFLIEDVVFENRDAAYDFIKHVSVPMANAFVLRKAYEEGAVN